MMVFPYSPPQRLEANESPLFVDVSGCVAAVAHRNFIVTLSSSRIFSRSFPLLFPSYSQPKAFAEESSLP